MNKKIILKPRSDGLSKLTAKLITGFVDKHKNPIKVGDLIVIKK